MGETLRRRAEELFQQAADLPPERRPAFLDQHCPSAPAVRRQVERLLDRFENGTVESLARLEQLDGPDVNQVGERLGRYKLLERIGEGGFGVVYLAEQETPVRREVALKIIKLGMDTRRVIARFEAERQALAMMEHPNIAGVFDAGATDTGRPYFVMELVAGTPITEYCDENRLTTRQRLELFLQVCAAVQHAHQKGVIHRDLKPGNILVTVRVGTPMPKVIDFGIAKATSGQLAEKTLFTDVLHFLGTPEYMSPEQAKMTDLDVDTRSDVYSLGVVLYELLTGTTPFETAKLRQAAFGEIQQIIGEKEPPTPSQRLSTLGEGLARAARVRGVDPHGLRRLIRGDLDWIVMRALEKEPERRYDTPASLADDIRRHLNHQAVSAGPPGAAYRLGKFMRRNRMVVTAAALIGAAILIGSGMAMTGFVRARAEAESARAINAFFNDMIVSVDPLQLRLLSAFAPDTPVPPSQSGGFARDVSVAEMMQAASARIDESFRGKPELAATAHETIGMTLRGVGRYAEAEPHLQAALETRRRVLGEEHPDTLRSSLALGDLLFEVGRPTDGEPLVRSACPRLQRIYGDDHPKTLSCAAILAAVLADCGRFDESESLFERTLEAQRRVLGSEHRDTLATMWKWSVSCLLQSKTPEGPALARELYEISQRALKPGDSLNILSRPLMGWWYVTHRRYDDAQAVLRPGLAQCRRILGEDHPLTYQTMLCLARSLQGSDLQADKERLYRQALAGLRKRRGRLHWQTLSATAKFAYWLDLRGEFRAAEEFYRRLVADSAEAFGEEHQYTLGHMQNLAALLERGGKLDEAIALRRRRLGIIRAHEGAESPRVLHDMDQLAKALLRMGRIDPGRRATQELIAAVWKIAAKHDDDAQMLNTCAYLLLTCAPADLRDPARMLPLAERAAELSGGTSAPILDTLALAYHQAGEDRQAAEMQRKAVALLEPESKHPLPYYANLVKYLREQGDAAAVDRYVREGVTRYREALGEENPLRAVRFTTAGGVFACHGHLAIAEALLEEALQRHRDVLGDEHEQVAETLVYLARVHAQRNRYGQAAQTERAALALRRKLLGNGHLQVAESLHSVGRALHATGDSRGAVDVLREALEVYRELQAEEVPAALDLKGDLAEALVAFPRLDEAEPLAREVLTRSRAGFGEQHFRTVRAMRTLGRLLSRQGNLPEAEALLRGSLETCQGLDLPEHEAWLPADIEAALGHCLTLTRQFDEAEVLLLRGQRGLQAAKGSEYIGTQTAARQLVSLYEAWGRPRQAAHWRTKLLIHPPPGDMDNGTSSPRD